MTRELIMLRMLSTHKPKREHSFDWFCTHVPCSPVYLPSIGVLFFVFCSVVFKTTLFPVESILGQHGLRGHVCKICVGYQNRRGLLNVTICIKLSLNRLPPGSHIGVIR